MARTRALEFRSALSRQAVIFNLALLLCVFLGILCIAGSVIWKNEYLDKKDKLLIFELGQTFSGGVADQKGPPADKIKELITGVNDREMLGADVLRDLGIALFISVFVTFSIERYSSDRLRQHITYD